MKSILSLLAVAALAWGPLATAADITVAVGRTDDSTNTYRLGMQWDFQRSWWESRVGRLSGYWDAGYTYWQGDKASSNHSLSLAPVLVYEFGHGGVRPFVELGIGVALFEDAQIEERKLGSSFQFEDRMGFGVRFGEHRVGVRAMHYSNAGLQSPNDGVESYSLYYRVAL